MRELSLNILDICKNSTKAGATKISINLEADEANDLFSIEIIDNGCGMEEEFLKSIADPFTTTRTTRKVGMGIPLFKMSAETSGGSFEISSKLGVGTRVFASYQISSVDKMPLGDFASTIQLLILGDPEIDFCAVVKNGENQFEFSSGEVSEMMGDVGITNPDVIAYIYDLMKENTYEILGGKI